MEILKKVILITMIIVLSLCICISNLENGVLLSVLSIIAIVFFVKKVKIRNFTLFLVAFSLISKVIAVFILKVPMTADYQTMYNASINAVNGDFSFINSGYFLAYGYQLAHVFYQALILKIINNVIVLKILNCVYATVITVLIYKIVKVITRENVARITSLIYAISLYPIYLNVILGNQQLSVMLFLIGIYILLTKKSSILNGIIIGILFALGNLERPEGIIYITTLIVYNIVTLKSVKIILKNTLPILITYFALTQLFSYVLIKSDINEIGFGNSDPYWKFLLGFNYEYNGKNNLEDYQYTSDINLEKEVLIDRITDVKRIPNLFYQKIKIQWLYDDLDTTFNAINTTQFSQGIVKIIVKYISTINLIVIIAVFIGLIKNKKIDSKNYFFIINVLVYFAVYLLIEVSARYYYNPQISIIILSALGIERIIDFTEKYGKVKEEMKEKD